jgi:uncharacterized protein DUF4230
MSTKLSLQDPPEVRVPAAEAGVPVREVRIPASRRPVGWLAVLAGAVAVVTVAAVAVVTVVLSAVHLLPRLHNPFAESTTVHTQPPLLTSITALSRYEAASGSFQVVVDLSRKSAYLPGFVEGSDTLFVADGTDAAFVDFAGLRGQAIHVSPGRTAVTVQLPAPQLEPAALNVRQSYVYAQQQGLLNRIGNFFSGNPDSQQQVYVLAQQRIQAAARRSPLVTEAEQNTRRMLTGMLHSLGYAQVTVNFAAS